MFDGVRVFDDFTTFDALIDNALKEAGYFAGYGTVFKRTYLLEESREEGEALVKKANAARAALYRAKNDREAERLKAQAQSMAGTFDAEEFSKGRKKSEDRILSLAFDVVRLRQPFDDFLVDNDIPERTPYNPSDPRMGKHKRAAANLG